MRRPKGGGRRRVTLVVDPRFPGGTSSAVAAEIGALATEVDLDVVAIETGMFPGRDVNARLLDALDAHRLELRWTPPVVRADVVVFHNLTSLKFETGLKTRFSCAVALVVTHENLVQPGGAESFDVAHCLHIIDAALVCGTRRLAPVSAANRRTVQAWTEGAGAEWRLAPFDWFNVCDMPMRPPTPAPRDRRGRHSRPGLEKFPPRDVMLHHFPTHAQRVAILGADLLLLQPEPVPRNWELWRFGEMDVDRFLEQIDFVVYFTHPFWRESFGRAIAEAIAAGKVVITDPATAEPFGSGVITSDGDNVDAIIERLVAEPARYGEVVARGQRRLAELGPAAFRGRVLAGLDELEGEHALL